MKLVLVIESRVFKVGKIVDVIRSKNNMTSKPFEADQRSTSTELQR